MILRVVVAAVVVTVAVMAAIMIERRRARPVTVGGIDVPTVVNRSDFQADAVPWIVVIFTNTDCDSCVVMRERVTALGRDAVAVYEVDYAKARPVHERYGITAVPTTVVVDEHGDVRASWVGKVSTEELERELTQLGVPPLNPPLD